MPDLPLQPHTVELDVPADDDADAAIGRVAQLLSGHPAVLEFPRFLADLRARERLTSTVMGHGIAIPHARTTCVRDIVVAAGRCREGIKFGSNPENIHLLFVIGVPPHMVREYLGLLSELSRRLKEPAVRESLMQAESAEAFLAALNLS